MYFDVNFQFHFIVEFFATNITNMGGADAVFILFVLFQSRGVCKQSVARFAMVVFSVFHHFVFPQSLPPIELLTAMFTSVGCIQIWVVFPFVFVHVENVTI